MDWRWLATFVAQLGAGLALIFTGTQEDLGTALVGGAFGQGITGGITMRR